MHFAPVAHPVRADAEEDLPPRPFKVVRRSASDGVEGAVRLHDGLQSAQSLGFGFVCLIRCGAGSDTGRDLPRLCLRSSSTFGRSHDR